MVVRFKPHNSPILQEAFVKQSSSIDTTTGSVWDVLASLPALTVPAGVNIIPQSYRSRVIAICDNCWSDEVRRLSQRRVLKADERLVSQLVASGTITDRIAALTLRINAAPLRELHGDGAFSELLTMCFAKQRQNAALACDHARDLLISLLPTDRVIKPVADCPELLGAECNKRHAVIYAYAAALRRAFLRLCEALEILAADTVAHWRAHAARSLSTIATQLPLMSELPARILVGKFGDPDTKVRGAVRRALAELLAGAPAATEHVVFAVMALVDSRRLPLRGVTAAVDLLAGVRLKREWETLAERLVVFCLGIFKTTIEKVEGADAFDAKVSHAEAFGKTTDEERAAARRRQRRAQQQLKHRPNATHAQQCAAQGETAFEGRLIMACLTAVHRFIPYLPSESACIGQLEPHLKIMYRAVYTAPMTTAALALQLVTALDLREGVASERLASAIAGMLARPELRATGPQRQRQVIRAWHQVMAADAQAIQAAAAAGGGDTEATARLARRSAGLFRRLLITTTTLTPGPAAGFLVAADDVARRVNPDLRELFLAAPRSYAPVQLGDLRHPGDLAQPGAGAWEVTALRRAAHPSLAIFADQTLSYGAGDLGVVYNSDPFIDFRLMNFLDKFCARRPKVRADGKRATAIAPWELGARDEADVAADERFMHAYYRRYARAPTSRGIDEADIDQAIRKSLAKQGLTPDAAIEDEDEAWEFSDDAGAGAGAQGMDLGFDDNDAGSAFATASDTEVEDYVNAGADDESDSLESEDAMEMLEEATQAGKRTARPRAKGRAAPKGKGGKPWAGGKGKGKGKPMGKARK